MQTETKLRSVVGAHEASPLPAPATRVVDALLLHAHLARRPQLLQLPPQPVNRRCALQVRRRRVQHGRLRIAPGLGGRRGQGVEGLRQQAGIVVLGQLLAVLPRAVGEERRELLRCGGLHRRGDLRRH